MPSIDLEAIQAEDEIFDNEPGLPYRFGIEHEVNLDMENSGIWVDLPNGARLWRLAIYAPEALSINLVYEDFFLPQGSKFFLHNGDYDQILGAFTARNNKSDRAFGTALVYGETSYLEYYEPAQVRGQGNIVINKVVHGYRSIFKSNNQLGNSGSCNVDTECSQGDDWRDEIRAVGKTIAGGFLCTGTLVGNATGDLRPYFLTANHCGFFSSMVVYWLFERPNCGSGTPDDTKTTTGGTLLASVDGNTGGSIRVSDHLLIELSENPSDAFNVYYAGWDANGAIPQAVTGIHHPAGDAKKISMENDPLTSTVYLQNNTNPNAGQWRVADWDSGTTEGGSSGSPIFDNVTKRIVGMLSGGFAACGNNSADWYGKFSFAWNNNGTTNPAFRLRDWLDPNNTGILAIDGYDTSGGGGTDFSLSSSSTSEENCSDDDVINSVSYTIMVQTNSGSTDPVTLSVTGEPSGASVSFSTNPVVPGNSTVLTIGGLTSVAVGDYVLNVEGTNTSGSANLQLNLKVLDNCATICDNTMSTDVPTAILNSATVESDIVITRTGTITDVNVSFSGTHGRIRDLTFELRSPSGTRIQLVDLDDPCNGRQRDFDFGFDDQSTLTIDDDLPCPPTSGLNYQPEQALSAFNNEEINGTWTLFITDDRNRFTGELEAWQLDICTGGGGMGGGPTCNDGIQNGLETGVDCGGPDCPPCMMDPTCDDGIQNGLETGVDCGGPDCPPCMMMTCDVPTGLFETNNTGTSVTLNWTAVPAANTYTVQGRQAGTTRWRLNQNSSTNSTTISNNIVSGVTYEWRVRSNCDDGMSDFSAIATFTAGSSASGDIENRNGNIEMDATLQAKVYPSPTSDLLNIVTNQTVEQIEIVDMTGKVVRTVVTDIDHTTTQLNINYLTNGHYFVRIKTVDDVQTLRFVKI
ncbi:MAG: T9SS type A sorting domain-containing protein [Bacteroidota bacterium]